MENIIVVICLAAGIAALGIYMIASGNVRLLHSYHYASVPADELPALAREQGACMIGTALGIVFLGCEGILPDWGTAVGMLLFVLSIGGMFFSIIRHNGSLVSFGPRPGVIPCGRTIAVVALSCLIAVPVAAFGVYMALSGDVRALHGYHYAGLNDAARQALALVEGLCMVGLGVSIPCIMGGGVRIGRKPAPLWSKILMIGGTVLLVACLAVMLLAIPALGGSLV